MPKSSANPRRNVKTRRWGKWPFSDLFSVHPHNTTQHTHTIPHVFLSVSFGFQCFIHTHTAHNIHTRTHTCTPATDRDLESGLSKSHTRKNPGKCLKKAKSGETLARARADTDGQIVRLRRSDDRPIEPSGSWFPPNFPSFSRKKKRMIRGIGHMLFSTYSQTLNV